MKWDESFFNGMGLESKYIAFAQKEWKLHTDNSSDVDQYWLNYILTYTGPDNVHVLVAYPRTRGKHQNGIIKLLAPYVSILAQRYIHFRTKEAADLFIQHIYKGEDWVDWGGSFGKTNPCFPKGLRHLPIWVVFFQTSVSLEKVTALKGQIRSLFHINPETKAYRKLFEKNSYKTEYTHT